MNFWGCLVKYFCFPLLCYCIGSHDFISSQINYFVVCSNDCFRRIFGFTRYESVKLLQFYCKELPLEYIVALYKWKFLTSRVSVSDRFIFFYEYIVHVLNKFYNKYALHGSSSSSSHTKCAVMDHFSAFHYVQSLWLLLFYMFYSIFTVFCSLSAWVANKRVLRFYM